MPHDKTVVGELMKIKTMLLKASDKSILVFYKVSHFIILIVVGVVTRQHAAQR